MERGEGEARETKGTLRKKREEKNRKKTKRKLKKERWRKESEKRGNDVGKFVN